jgi:hypothetical protein
MAQQDQAAARLKRVRMRVERWRRTRRKQSPMPAALWEEAVGLARELGPYPVKAALRLNYESLKQRLADGSRSGAVPGKAAPQGFVELSGVQLLGAASPLISGAEVEVADSEGARLTVRLAAGSELDVARLVEAFRRQA